LWNNEINGKERDKEDNDKEDHEEEMIIGAIPL